MSSSTSSSRFWFSLIAAIAMVAAYTIAAGNQQAKVTHYQNQWVKNYSTVERFLYAESKPELVIVGSSLAARLYAEEIGASTHNLALASTGSLSGLAIIEQSGIRPTLILVESNILEKERDQEMLDRLFTPVLWRIKARLQALQFTYQPVNFLISWIYHLKGPETDDNSVNKTVFEKEVRRRTRKSEYTEDLVTTPVFTELAATIERLEKAGTRVVLFDAPMDPRVASTTRYKTRQRLVRQLLPELPWLKLSEQEHAQYQTSDGAHLLPGPARSYSRYLREMLVTIEP